MEVPNNKAAIYLSPAPEITDGATEIKSDQEERKSSKRLSARSLKQVSVMQDTGKKMMSTALMFASSVSKFKMGRQRSISGTAIIDPLTWSEISTFKWWPGILGIITSYAIAPCITSLFFIGIGWKDMRIYPERWWQCGVYCSALWLTVIQVFGFYLIQIKVRTHNNYANFVPSFWKTLILYISSAIFAMMIWMFCYYANNNSLIHPLGNSYAVAFAGIFGTSVFQTKFLVPKEIPAKDIFCLQLFGLAMVPVALLPSLGCIVLYIYGGAHVLMLGVFPISRTLVDMLMRQTTRYTNSGFLECIFIHISALCNNIFLIYTISYKGASSYEGIVFAGLMNGGVMVYYYFVITLPLECQMGMEALKETFEAWLQKREPEYPPLTISDITLATKLRSKLIYMVILDMASQLILPWWLPLQLALIMFYTPANTSMVTLGFAVTPESFSHRYNTAMILNGLDIFNMGVLTYFIRRKYPLFDPLRILHMMFEKFGLLPVAGIIYILISIICFFIWDCGMDPDQLSALFQN